MRHSVTHAFTLVELLVAITILALLVLFVSSMLTNATKVTSVSTKRMEADSQERQLLDRMAIDFAQMVKRKDVRYYVKNAGAAQSGNDLIAFFSTVPGYYPSTQTNHCPISLVAYRVNSNSSSTAYNRLERMAKGLEWNGLSSSYTPILFNTSIASTWNAATNSTATDNDYEIAGSRVFRFEYYYLLKPDPSTGTPRGYNNGAFWASTDTFNTVLGDAGSTIIPGQLLSQWQTALDGVTNMPREAISNVRLYERYFYLSSPAP